MYDHGDVGNAFAIPDLWQKSTLIDLERSVNSSDPKHEGPLFASLESMRDGLHSGNGIETPVPRGIITPGEYFSASFPIPSAKDLDLHLPDLSSFEYGPLENLENPELSSASSVDGSIGAFSFQEEEDEDIWSSKEIINPPPVPAEFKSWEKFLSKASKEPSTAYFSEGGPSVFDALISQSLRSQTDLPAKLAGHVLQCGPVLESLLQLGLGRESSLYRWVEQESSFRPFLEDGRVSGYTSKSFNSLAAQFIGYGNQMRELRSFIEASYHSSKPIASLIAMAHGFTEVLTTLETQLSPSSITLSSLLQLQSLFHRPALILSCLNDMVARLSTARTDKELLSKLYDLALELELSTTWLRPVVFQILAHVSRPWLDSVSGWIGLRKEFSPVTWNPPRDSVTLEAKVSNDEDGNEIQELDAIMLRSMPSFMTSENANSIIEAGIGLQILRAHKPEHPLGRLEVFPSLESSKLEWQFLWQDAERIQAQAEEYENSLLKIISEFDLSTSRGQMPCIEEESLQQMPLGLFEASMETSKEDYELPLEKLNMALPELRCRDMLSETVVRCSKLCNESMEDEAAVFAPPLSLVPLLSFTPIIATQARLVNKACLRLLFKEHSLRSHLSLQYRYHFLGDGMFASRLSHALFDPDLRSAERRKGRSRSGLSGTSGLQLGSRDNWPPASSELRLALMGILSESYHQNRQAEGSSSRRPELPGGLSFAIREMSEDELQRCLDPDSIEALDFLRLQYRPPPPLDVIITVSSLKKYDCIFKLLLRAIRMTFVINQLFHNRLEYSVRLPHNVAQRFTIEARHFVSATCGYFFDGVADSWAIFEEKLANIEERLNDHSEGNTEGIHMLRNFHEQVLDRIMFTLILRKRQGQIMKLLEEIFASILKFSSTTRSTTRSTPVNEMETKARDTKIQEVYERFRKKARVFISVCKGLSERRAEGGTTRHDPDNDLFMPKGADEDGENTIGRLLLKLEMSGYYSKPAK